jgi:hypothetical protein
MDGGCRVPASSPPGHGNTQLFGHESDEDIVHKFVFLADDRNIAQVWVDGVKVKDILATPAGQA